MSDLEQLRADYPGWRFGTLWAGTGSGGQRALWATRVGVVLCAFSAAGLREKIKREGGQHEPGAEASV